MTDMIIGLFVGCGLITFYFFAFALGYKKGLDDGRRIFNVRDNS